jgi:perosamine synthetase
VDRIPVAGPWITQKEIDYVTQAVRQAWYSDANVFHERFERAFSEYLGVRHAVALPSCTSAIHLSLLALGIGGGDEVIVPDITWIASAAPISYVGAKPVFCDIDPENWCMSPAALERCIGPNTKAIIPVDLYGNMPEMQQIQEIADRHGIWIVEDAAEALGSEYAVKKAGTFGTTGVFSFHGSKTVTTGEGGMLVTDREDISQRVRFLADHGRAPGDVAFWNTEVAFKYKISSLQAALGLAQVERLQELIHRKREIFRWYQEALHDDPFVKLNADNPRVNNSYWMVTAVIDATLGLRKERLIRHMRDRNVDCRPFFYPLSSLPAYEESPDAERAREENTVSYAISPYGINLPSGFNMTEERVNEVCALLKEALYGREASEDST